jgi:hypothetical protein
MIGAHAQPEGDEVRGLDPTVRARENERCRTFGHVDSQCGRRIRRRERPRTVLDKGVTQHDGLVVSAAKTAEGLDHLGGRCETLELERIGAQAERLGNARVEESKNPQHRPLRAASETQRLEKLGQGALVLRSTPDYDDVGLRVAKSLRRFDERPRIGRSNASHDLNARCERELCNRTARCVLATVKQRDTKRSTECDAGLLDRGLGPGRDRHRDAVVVRAAS